MNVAAKENERDRHLPLEMSTILRRKRILSAPIAASVAWSRP